MPYTKKTSDLLNSPLGKAWVISLMAIYPVQYIIRATFHLPIDPFENNIVCVYFIMMLVVIVMQYIITDELKNNIKEYRDHCDEMFILSKRFKDSYDHAADINKQWIKVNDDLEKINIKLNAEIFQLKAKIFQMERQHDTKI